MKSNWFVWLAIALVGAVVIDNAMYELLRRAFTEPSIWQLHYVLWVIVFMLCGVIHAVSNTTTNAKETANKKVADSVPDKQEQQPAQWTDEEKERLKNHLLGDSK